MLLFNLLHWTCLYLQLLCFIILLHTHKDTDMLIQFNELFREMSGSLEALLYFSSQIILLHLLLLFKLFQTQISGGLIIWHVAVPCVWEFNELVLLCIFNLKQLSLLSLPHINSLPLRLSLFQFIHLPHCLRCFSELPIHYTLFLISLENSENIHNLVIRSEINSCSGK